MAESNEEVAILRQRAWQYLVHSFLYYRLGEPVVSDEFYDKLVAELNELRGKHQGVAMPFAEVIDPALGAEGSGFSIRDYPPQIVTAAFKLLYATSSPQTGFVEFVEQRGYQAHIQPE